MSDSSSNNSTMEFSLPELVSEHFSSTSYGVVYIAATIIFLFFRLSRGPNLNAFPTVGSGSWLGPWWDGFKYPTNAIDFLQKGYKKHKTAPFKVADLFRWIVIVSRREHVEELVRASEEDLSAVEGTNGRLNTRYTLGNEIHDSPYHVGIIQAQLTRSIGTLYSEIRDEIVTSFDELLDLRGEEWKGVPAVNLAHQVVCRTSNRLFVGLPLCRDPDWVDLNIQYTRDIGKAGYLLRLFPKFTRSLAVRLFTDLARGAERGLKHLTPMIEERLKDLNEYEDGKVQNHNDLLAWLIDEATGAQLMPKSLTSYVMSVNVAAIHASSNTFTHALFYLAENPQYIQPLREEVESIIKKDGWSKAAVSKMCKVDSFLRECQRLEGIDGMAVVRQAMKDYTFKDGTFMPKGTLIGVASRALHYEEKLYKNPNAFQPFRFSDPQGEDEEGTKVQFVTTGTEYLVFGHGKHGCPGRFFAANELKSMLAHVVVTYDIELEDKATRPPSFHFGTSILADPQAKILFRKRAD